MRLPIYLEDWSKIYVSGLPCNHYSILNEASRNQAYGKDEYCDNNFNGSVWYRMMSPAGTMIPEQVVPQYKCGTHATGWMNGVHPTTLGEEVERQICFKWGSNDCSSSINIKVINCMHYYIYKLEPTGCNWRYCSSQACTSSSKNHVKRRAISIASCQKIGCSVYFFPLTSSTVSNENWEFAEFTRSCWYCVTSHHGLR